MKFNELDFESRENVLARARRMLKANASARIIRRGIYIYKLQDEDYSKIPTIAYEISYVYIRVNTRYYEYILARNK